MNSGELLIILAVVIKFVLLTWVIIEIMEK